MDNVEIAGVVRRHGVVFVVWSVLLGAACFAQVNDDFQPSPMNDSATQWRTSRHCGLNSLYVFLNLTNCAVSYDRLSAELPITERGASLLHLKNLAAKYGLNPKVVRIRPKDLDAGILPAIALLESGAHGHGHFVVIVSKKTESLELIDGTTGIVSVTRLADFMKIWDGVVLIDAPTCFTPVVLLFALFSVLGIAVAVRILRRRISPMRQQVLSCILAFATVASVAQASENAVMESSIEPVYAALSAQRNSWTSIFIRSNYSARCVGSAEDVAKYFGTKYLTSEVHEYAMKRNKRYYSFQRTENIGDKYASLKPLGGSSTDPITAPANLINAFDGATLRRRDSGGTQCTIVDLSVPQLDDLYFKSRYLNVICQPPDDVLTAPRDQSEHRFLDALSGGRCKIRSELEAISGHPCVVIDWSSSFRRTLWCDPKLGYAIRQHHVYSPEKGLLQWKVSHADFVKVGDAAWFPKKITSERCAPETAPPELAEKPLLAYDYQVEKISVNDVSDEFFEMQPPPGVLIVDFANGEYDNTLDRRVAKYGHSDASGKFVEILPQKPLDVKAVNRTRYVPYLLLVNCLAIVGIAGFWWYRSRRRTS